MTIRLQLWLGLMVCGVLLLAVFAAVAAIFVGWLAPGIAASWSILAAFGLAGIIALALFAPLAWLVSRLAYAPVRDVTKTARSIMTTGQLDRRCFYAGPRAWSEPCSGSGGASG